MCASALPGQLRSGTQSPPGRGGWLGISVLEVRCVSQEPKPGAGIGRGKELGSTGHISWLSSLPHLWEEKTGKPWFPGLI